MHINSCIYLQPANHAVEQGEMHFRFRCYRNPNQGWRLPGDAGRCLIPGGVR